MTAPTRKTGLACRTGSGSEFARPLPNKYPMQHRPPRSKHCENKLRILKTDRHVRFAFPFGFTPAFASRRQPQRPQPRCALGGLASEVFVHGALCRLYGARLRDRLVGGGTGWFRFAVVDGRRRFLMTLRDTASARALAELLGRLVIGLSASPVLHNVPSTYRRITEEKLACSRRLLMSAGRALSGNPRSCAISLRPFQNSSSTLRLVLHLPIRTDRFPTQYRA